MISEFINGAWEEPNVTGIRIEINAPELTVLWMGGIVLQTVFKTVGCGDHTKLILEKNGMRYKNTYTDYASVESIVFAGDTLILTEDFPITGKSVSKLKKTDNTRYGNYDIADEMLAGLEGEWVDGDGYLHIKIKKDRMEINGDKTRIHVLHPRYQSGRELYYIADADPSVREWHGISELAYTTGEPGILRASIRVCDAGPHIMLLEKVK